MTQSKKAPDKSHREVISLIELFEMFPDEKSGRHWFESIIWKGGRAVCHRCGGTNTYEVKNTKPLPHRCRDCRKHFSFRHRTILERSHIPLHKWAIAIYLVATNHKGVSSMKLHRDLDISQRHAWAMLHKIRQAMSGETGFFSETVEVEETRVGGIEKNKHQDNKLNTGRDGVGKSVVIGAKDRNYNKFAVQVVENKKRATLHGFIQEISKMAR